MAYKPIGKRRTILTENNNIKVISDLPRRMLSLVCATLNEDFQIHSIMTDHQRAPVIKTPVGNVIYFSSSGDFRLHLNRRGPMGESHKTRKSPDAIILLIKELVEE